MECDTIHHNPIFIFMDKTMKAQIYKENILHVYKYVS